MYGGREAWNVRRYAHIAKRPIGTNREKTERGKAMNKKLVKAVIRQLGCDKNEAKDVLHDVTVIGADGGFHGFIYYTETEKFFRANKKEIVAHAEELADGIGESTLNMIQGFNCLGKDFSLDEIGRTIYGPWKDDEAHQMIANAMSWFALEEVANYITEGYEA